MFRKAVVSFDDCPEISNMFHPNEMQIDPRHRYIMLELLQYTGQDPVLAMQLVHQLRLFPTVFEPPKAQQAALGDGFGGSCVACIAAAAQLLSAWQPQA